MPCSTCWPMHVTAPGRALGARWWARSSPRWALRGWGCSGFPWASELLHVAGALLSLPVLTSVQGGSEEVAQPPSPGSGGIAEMGADSGSLHITIKNSGTTRVTRFPPRPLLKPSQLLFFFSFPFSDADSKQSGLGRTSLQSLILPLAGCACGLSLGAGAW